MAQEPWYDILCVNEATKALQEEAILEVLRLTPGEKQSGLGSYGLTDPCRDLSKVVIRGMNGALEKWATSCGLAIKDLDKPFYRPEAFRLQKGCSLWTSRDCTALLMPLSHSKAQIHLLPRGSNTPIPHDWDPGTVIHLNEMGFEFRGNGSVRFIFIIFRTAPCLEYRVW
ncbi:hypothetical protein FSARC_6239 [Fusarium sarcochroum]|uniref:Uncharacterized protein n=1 Tax=Fusarium sarcochroum TaxID=1208366 RepID=A0A8H4TY33_9HYPO|nr:hypothetical protein FSARC_6239 [Fusarium sarcochroum]